MLTGRRLREILNLRWRSSIRTRRYFFLTRPVANRHSGAAIAVLESIPRVDTSRWLARRKARRLKRPVGGDPPSCRAGSDLAAICGIRRDGAGSNLGLGHRKIAGAGRARTCLYAHIAADPLKTVADAIASKLAPMGGGAITCEGRQQKALRPILKGGELGHPTDLAPAAQSDPQKVRGLRRAPDKAWRFEKDALIRPDAEGSEMKYHR